MFFWNPVNISEKTFNQSKNCFLIFKQNIIFRGLDIDIISSLRALDVDAKQRVGYGWRETVASGSRTKVRLV